VAIFALIQAGMESDELLARSLRNRTQIKDFYVFEVTAIRSAGCGPPIRIPQMARPSWRVMWRATQPRKSRGDRGMSKLMRE